MLVEGRHFLSTVAPERLGHKALAVNLSDLAACGAEPLAFTLALAMPRVDEAFLEGFARGLFALADEHGIELVGGDTTAGPLEHLHHGLRRGACRPGAAALGRPRGRRRCGSAIRQRWARRCAPGARGLSRHACRWPARRSTRCACAWNASAARRARPGAARRGHAARSTSATAWSATSAMCSRARASARRSNADALPTSAVLAAHAARIAARMHAGRRRRLRTAVQRAAARAARRAWPRPRRPAVAVTRIGRIDAAPGLRIVDGDGAPLARASRPSTTFAATP